MVTTAHTFQPIERRHAAEQLARQFAFCPRLEDRLTVAVDILGPGVRFSTSLGIEDQTVLHAIATARAPIEVFTLDTGRHFAETYDVLAASEARYGLRIKVISPEASDVQALVARDGINGFRDSVKARKMCCDVRKVRPLRRALDGASGWLTGLRRGQSQGRTNVPFADFDAEFGVVKVNLLADWSLDQVEAYIAEHRVPLNALHGQGFPSIGCQPCTRAIRPGEDIRAGRWWWENPVHNECGLHRRPPRNAT